ncbi:oxidoreductase, short chain dehydrogenase, partial [Reticulomyxa filosa]
KRHKKDIYKFCLLCNVQTFFFSYVTNKQHEETKAKKKKKCVHVVNIVDVGPGASSGLGEHLAYELARRNPECTLFLQGRKRESLRAVVKTCMEKYGCTSVSTFVCDVRIRDTLVKWILTCDEMKPLDLVIANAGVDAANAEEIGKDYVSQLSQMFEVNVVGAVNTILPIIPRMQQREHGHIALMSSIGSYGNQNVASSYNATKAFIRLLGENLSWVLRYKNIDVTVINPGWVKTNLIAKLQDKHDWRWEVAIDAEDAAVQIVDGLCRGVSSIDFPWYTWFMAWYSGGIHPTFRNALAYSCCRIPSWQADKKFPSQPKNIKLRKADTVTELKHVVNRDSTLTGKPNSVSIHGGDNDDNDDNDNNDNNNNNNSNLPEESPPLSTLPPLPVNLAFNHSAPNDSNLAIPGSDFT